MAEDRRLDAVLSAKEDVTDSLSDIANAAEGAATSMEWLDSAGESASDSLDAVKRSAEATSNSLSGITDNAAEASAGLGATQAAADEVSDEFDEATRSVLGYGAALSTLSIPALGTATVGTAIEDPGTPDASGTNVRIGADLDVGSFTAARTAIKGILPDDHTVDVRASADGRSFGVISTAIDALADFHTTDVRAAIDETSFLDAHRAIRTLPDEHTVDVRADRDIDSFDADLGLDPPGRLSTGVDVDTPDSLGIPMPDGGIIDFEAAMPDLSQLDLDREATVGVEADVDEQSFGTARSIIDSILPDSETVEVEADTDVSLAQRAGRAVGPGLFAGGTLSRPDWLDFDFDIPTPGLGNTADEIDDVGDSASEASGPLRNFIRGLGELGGLSSQMTGLARLSGVFGGLGSSISSVSGAAGIAVGAIAALQGALSGLAGITGALTGFGVALGGIGAALAGIVGAGLYEKGEQMAATSEDIEGAWEGAAAYIGTFKDEARDALAPLFALDTDEFIGGFIRTGISELQNFAQFASNLFEPIQEMTAGIGDTWAEQSPRIWNEWEKTVESLMPATESALSGVIEGIPDFLAWARNMAESVGPDLAEFGSALGGLFEAFSRGSGEWGSILLDFGTILIETFTAIMDAVSLVTGVFDDDLAGVLNWTADLVKGVSDSFSGFVQWFLALDKLGDVNPEKMSAVVHNLTIGAVESLTNAAITGFEGLISGTLKVINSGIEEVNKIIPGTQFDLGTLNTDVNLGRADFGNRKRDVAPEQPGMQTTVDAALESEGVRAGGGGDYVDNRTINVDASGNGASAAEIESRVLTVLEQQAAEEENKRKRLHPTN